MAIREEIVASAVCLHWILLIFCCCSSLTISIVGSVLVLSVCPRQLAMLTSCSSSPRPKCCSVLHRKPYSLLTAEEPHSGRDRCCPLSRQRLSCCESSRCLPASVSCCRPAPAVLPAVSSVYMATAAAGPKKGLERLVHHGDSHGRGQLRPLRSDQGTRPRLVQLTDSSSCHA